MIEIRCPQCNKLLFKAEGFGTQIEGYCWRCKIHILWPSNVAQVLPKPLDEFPVQPPQAPSRPSTKH